MGESEALASGSTDPTANLSANHHRCTIVVPCYNEAHRLPSEKFVEFVHEGRNIDFLFVNDGSTDDTIAVLERLQRVCGPAVALLDKKVNGEKPKPFATGS